MIGILGQFSVGTQAYSPPASTYCVCLNGAIDYSDAAVLSGVAGDAAERIVIGGAGVADGIGVADWHVVSGSRPT